MKMIGSDVFVTWKELIEAGVLYTTLTNAKARNSASWHFIDDPADRRRVLIEYATLRPKYQALVKQHLTGDLEPHEYLTVAARGQQAQAAEQGKQTLRLAIAEAAGDTLTHLHHFSQLAPVESRELARAASVLACLAGWRKGTFGIRTESEMLETAIAELELLGLKRLKVTNTRVLARKLKQARQEGAQAAVKVPRKGNTNAAKLSDWMKAAIEHLYADGQNYSSPQIKIKLADLASRYGEQMPADSTLRTYLARPDVQNRAHLGRYGAKSFKDKVLPYVPFQKPLYAGDLWCMDGTQAQLYCVNAKGQLDALQLFAVIDVYSEMVVGFSVARSENHLAIKNALRMAIDRTGYLPAELLMDNSSASKKAESEGFLTQMAKTIRRAKVGNAQDKPVERFFSAFQSVALSWYPNYMGEGIRSKRRDARPAPEVLARLLKEKALPNEATLRAQLAEAVAIWNASEVGGKRAPQLRHRESDRPNVLQADLMHRVRLFWYDTQVKISRSMVSFELGRQTHLFEIPSDTLRMEINGTRVRVRYDDRDMEAVHLFDLATDEYLCECKAIVRAHKATANQTGHDLAEMKRQQDQIDRYAAFLPAAGKQMVTEAEQQADIVAPFAAQTPRGLHKSRLEMAELAVMRRHVLAEAGHEEHDVHELVEIDLDEPRPMPRPIVPRPAPTAPSRAGKLFAPKNDTF